MSSKTNAVGNIFCQNAIVNEPQFIYEPQFISGPLFEQKPSDQVLVTS